MSIWERENIKDLDIYIYTVVVGGYKQLVVDVATDYEVYTTTLMGETCVYDRGDFYSRSSDLDLTTVRYRDLSLEEVELIYKYVYYDLEGETSPRYDWGMLRSMSSTVKSLDYEMGKEAESVRLGSPNIIKVISDYVREDYKLCSFDKLPVYRLNGVMLYTRLHIDHLELHRDVCGLYDSDVGLDSLAVVERTVYKNLFNTKELAEELYWVNSNSSSVLGHRPYVIERMMQVYLGGEYEYGSKQYGKVARYLAEYDSLVRYWYMLRDLKGLKYISLNEYLGVRSCEVRDISVYDSVD